MFLLIFAFSSFASDINPIEQLEADIALKKAVYERAKQDYQQAKTSLQTAKNKLKAFIPATVVFNKNREWNPEKIIWQGYFWECANYNADATCEKVQLVEGAVVE